MTTRDSQQMRQPPDESRDDPLDRLLTTMYEKLSDRLAGGQRVDPRLIKPTGGILDTETEGFFPEEFRSEVTDASEWFDPAMFIRASQMDDPKAALNLSNIQAASGPGRDGKGMDWFRAGEAPNNFANRNNPLYVARKDFMLAVDEQIEGMFDVQGSAGHYRQPAASHAAPGGPSANSDHYSAGAVDYFGSKEELTRLRNWLVTQPWVSFVRWQTESHYDHVHVSTDLGWVAENYFGGGEVPQLTIEPAGQEATHTQAREQQQAPDIPETVQRTTTDPEIKVL